MVKKMEKNISSLETPGDLLGENKVILELQQLMGKEFVVFKWNLFILQQIE